MALTEVTPQTFEREVVQSEVPVLVNFTAAWCTPCRQLKPILKELAAEWQGRIKIVEFDVDQDPRFALQYRVMGVPTLILFVQGEVRERVTGLRPKAFLQKKFGKYLA